MKITKELVEKLSTKIPKKQRDKISEAIADKVGEIWHFICNNSGRTVEWWAFRNDKPIIHKGEEDGSLGGSFDPILDKEYIEIIGEIITSYGHRCPVGVGGVKGGFPTCWLWDDEWENKVLLDSVKNKVTSGEWAAIVRHVKSN